jgi:hypothetical protein
MDDKGIRAMGVHHAPVIATSVRRDICDDRRRLSARRAMADQADRSVAATSLILASSDRICRRTSLPMIRVRSAVAFVSEKASAIVLIAPPMLT